VERRDLGSYCRREKKEKNVALLEPKEAGGIVGRNYYPGKERHTEREGRSHLDLSERRKGNCWDRKKGRSRHRLKG